jgi:hypothetical protein
VGNGNNFCLLYSKFKLGMSHGAFELRLRYKSSTGTRIYLQLYLFGYDDETLTWDEPTNQTAYSYADNDSPQLVFPDGTWRTLNVAMEVPESWEARFIGFGIRLDGRLGGFGAQSDAFLIDQLQAFPVASS